jgi:hypothetical protein
MVSGADLEAKPSRDAASKPKADKKSKKEPKTSKDGKETAGADDTDGLHSARKAAQTDAERELQR